MGVIVHLGRCVAPMKKCYRGNTEISSFSCVPSIQSDDEVGLMKPSKAERILLDSVEVNLFYVRWVKCYGGDQSRIRGQECRDGVRVGTKWSGEAGLPEELTCEQSPEGSEEVSHAGVRGRAVPGCV